MACWTRISATLAPVGYCGGGGLPEPLGLMVDWASEAARLSVVHLLHHLGVSGLVGVGGKLDSDWLRAARGCVAVQVLDGVLRLRPLVIADEGHATGQTCRGQQKSVGEFSIVWDSSRALAVICV